MLHQTVHLISVRFPAIGVCGRLWPRDPRRVAMENPCSLNVTLTDFGFRDQAREEAAGPRAIGRCRCVPINRHPRSVIAALLKNIYWRAFPQTVSPECRRCGKLLPLHLLRATTCSLKAESRSFKHLMLISSPLARAGARGAHGRPRFYNGMTSKVSIFWLSRTTRRSIKR